MSGVKLGGIFTIGSSRRVLKAQWKNSGIPFYRGREITRLSKTGNAENELFISEDLYNDLSHKNGVPAEGDIMITAIGTIGNTYVVQTNDKFYFKDASVLWLKRSSDVDSNYVNHWFKSTAFFEQIGSNGTTVDTLTISKLQSLDIYLPSLEEQQRVVERLDAAFEKINRAIVLTEKNIINTRQLFENYLHKKMMNPSWKNEKLPNIATYFNGLTYKPSNVSDTGTIVLRSSNVQNDELSFRDVVRVSSLVKEKLYVENGDILMCSRNGSKKLIGKTALIDNLDERMTFGTFMMIIRGNLNPYLIWFFKSNLFRSQIFRGEATQINQITRYILDDVTVPVPPEEDIAAVADDLSNQFISSRKLEENYRKRIQRLSALKQSLLTRAFSQGGVE